MRILERIFAILRMMDVMVLDDERSCRVILRVAGRLGITYYDASYLIGAQISNRILVTDDERLREVAKRVNVKALTSHDLM